MYKNKKILAIIPARGGSKGLRNKNLRKLNSESLVGHSIKFAKQIKMIDLIIVSSDSKKINEESRKYGLKHYFTRPKNISGDRVSDYRVLRNALINIEKIKKEKFDVIIMLQPTSPLRKVHDIKNAIKKCIDRNFDCVWTVSKVEKKYHPLKQLLIKKKNIKLYNAGGTNIIARQQLIDTYYRNGAAYVYTRNCILKKRNFYPSNMGYVISRSDQISIDNIQDLKIVSKKFLEN